MRDDDDDDLVSVANFTAANARFYGWRSPRSSLSGVYRFSDSGEVRRGLRPESLRDDESRLQAGRLREDLGTGTGDFCPLLSNLRSFFITISVPNKKPSTTESSQPSSRGRLMPSCACAPV